eukprot:TRINITY_DN18432_c0_g1_i1.p1 TRINITY_DN18432_c0_g1~~TRINITY_DN18432_c0_g1_i1.p1  ORF type:complete len:122 (+),score=32.33 TRINITY_DN18432_c0_g1_i1:49-366(+)
MGSYLLPISQSVFVMAGILSDVAHQDVGNDMLGEMVDKTDILGHLADRGLLHITDKILKHLGAASLLSLRMVNHMHKELVMNSRLARMKVKEELAWLHRTPTSGW